MSRIEGGNNYEKNVQNVNNFTPIRSMFALYATQSCKNAMIAVQWRKYANF